MNMMTTNYLLVPGIINSNSGKIPIISNSKLTRFRTNPRRSYTAYERKVLFQCIKMFRTVDEAGSTSSASNSKSLPWQIITDDFNSRQGISAATPTQLQNLYRNIVRKRRKELKKPRLTSVVKVEREDDCPDESDQIKITDVVWADGSKELVMSSDNESEIPIDLDGESIEKDSGNSSSNANLPSKSASSNPSKSNLMKASSKAAEAFVELLNIAEPVTENNALVLKQKEEEHELKMSFLAEEHNMKMMVLQAKLDYYRTLREKVISHTSSKNET